MSVTSCTAHR